MTNGFGRVPVPAEVDAFKTEVSGDEDFVIFRDAQNRGVVSDSDQWPGRTRASALT